MIKLFFCHRSLIGILMLKITAKTDENRIFSHFLFNVLTIQDFNENMHRTVHFPNRWENLWNNINYLGVTEWIHKNLSRIELIYSKNCKYRMRIMSHSHLQSFRSQQKLRMSVKDHSWVKQVFLLPSNLKYFSVFGKFVFYSALGFVF